MDQWTNEWTNERTNGPMNGLINVMDQWTNGPMDQWTNELCRVDNKHVRTRARVCVCVNRRGDSARRGAMYRSKKLRATHRRGVAKLAGGGGGGGGGGDGP